MYHIRVLDRVASIEEKSPRWSVKYIPHRMYSHYQKCWRMNASFARINHKIIKSAKLKKQVIHKKFYGRHTVISSLVDLKQYFRKANHDR